jgi:hypothetical protein
MARAAAPPVAGTARARRPVEVTVAYDPQPGARTELVDLLLELLDRRRHSGGR